MCVWGFKGRGRREGGASTVKGSREVGVRGCVCVRICACMCVRACACVYVYVCEGMCRVKQGECTHTGVCAQVCIHGYMCEDGCSCACVHPHVRTCVHLSGSKEQMTMGAGTL